MSSDKPQHNDFAIFFPDLTLADQCKLANEMAQELLKAGEPQSSIQLARQNEDTQDLGSVVLIAGAYYLLDLAKDAGREFVKGASHKAGAKAVEWLLRKWGTRAEVRAPDGQIVTLGPVSERHPVAKPIPHPEIIANLDTLGLVVLGASKFDFLPEASNPAFARSAELAKEVFNANRTIFRDVLVLDLFDSEKDMTAIVEGMVSHAEAHPNMRDILIYYCGHGDFVRDGTQSYYLALRGTQKGKEPTTSLVLKWFRYMVESQKSLLNKRFYLILDACFSGAAVSAFQFGNVDALVDNQVKDFLPDRGWALLTASDRSKAAISRDGNGATMFTGALAAVLNQSPLSLRLSLADLCIETTRLIKSKHGLEGVLPQCHAPDQEAGDVSRIAFLVPKVQRRQSPLESYRVANRTPTPTAQQDQVSILPPQPLERRAPNILNLEPNQDVTTYIKELSFAIEIDPKDAFAFASRGKAHLQEGDHNRAISDLGRAIELYPNYPLAYLERARAYVAINEHIKSLSDYSKSIELNPKEGIAFIERGFIFAEKLQFHRAISDLTSAINIGDSRSILYFMRGEARAALSEFDLAIADFNEYTKHTETIYLDLDVYVARGCAYAEAGNQDAATTDFQTLFSCSRNPSRDHEAIKLRPKSSRAESVIMKCVHKALEISIDVCSKDIKKAPELKSPRGGSVRPARISHFLVRRAALYKEIGKYEAAISDYTAAISEQPWTESYYRNRAHCFQAMGDQQRADADSHQADGIRHKEREAAREEMEKRSRTELMEIRRARESDRKLIHEIATPKKEADAIEPKDSIFGVFRRK